MRAAHRVIGLSVGDEVRVEETAKVKRLVDGGHLEVVTRHRPSRNRKPADETDERTDTEREADEQADAARTDEAPGDSDTGE